MPSRSASEPGLGADVLAGVWRACLGVVLCGLSACSGSPGPVGATGAPSTQNTVGTTTPEAPGPSPTASTNDEEEMVNVLVFHKTGGYRHDSITKGVETIEELASTRRMTVTDTDDASWLNDADRFDVVVFLNTTGDVLDFAQQSSFEDYMASGGGFVGIHAATDTEYDWPWYGDLVGTYFADHPAPQRATVENANPGLDDLTVGLPDSFEVRDEWYNFRSMPGPDITVLAFVDESSYEGGTMGARHPIAWAHEYEGGKAVYLGFGHTTEAFDHEAVRTLLINGIEWAASS